MAHRQHIYNHRQAKISALCGIELAEPLAMAQKSLARLTAHCRLCKRPHEPGFISDDMDTCTQGHGCAASFSKDGKSGSAHYGSGVDDSRFHAMEPHRAALAGADPVCDSCLSSMELSGHIANVGEPAELGGYHAMPDSDKQARAVAAKRLVEQLEHELRWRSTQI